MAARTVLVVRLLHTSDWHLGRSFHREDLLGAQAAFVDHLVEVVRSERVDAVLVSGDLYDRALPPVDAVALCNEALHRLAALSVPTVVISGNHDSAQRLGFAADLIAAAGVHLRTLPGRAHEPVLLEDRHGPVAVYGIPYLEPDVARPLLGCDERGHAAVLGTAMDRVRADLAHRPGARSVVLAHAFVTGGEPSQSERDITVGGVAAVPLSTFDGASYTALGHLHGPQVLAETVRYSGSPLAYSFSEADHRKASWLVDLGPRGVEQVERVDAPVPRRLGRLRGRLEDLLADPRHADHEDRWLQVALTDPVRPREAMERLRTRFPHTLVLSFEPEGSTPETGGYAARVSGLSDLQIAARFVADVRSPATDPEIALLQQAFEAGRLAEQGA